MKAQLNLLLMLSFSTIISWLTGFLILSVLHLQKYIKSPVLRLVVDYAVGAGTTTLLIFAASVLSNKLNTSVIYIFILSLVIVKLTAQGAAFHLPKWNLSFDSDNKDRQTSAKENISKTNMRIGSGKFGYPVNFIYYAVIILILVFIIGVLIVSYKIMPLGFDVRYLYAFKAKMFLAAGKINPALFNIPEYTFSHSDYPLHIPLQIVYLSKLLGTVNLNGVKMLLLIYPVLLLIFVFGFLKAEVPGYIALLSAAVFITFQQIAGIIYAGVDIPLAFYILAGMSFYYEYIKTDNTNSLILSGMLLGISAWVKNEGMAFFIIVMLCVFIFTKSYLKKNFFISFKRTCYYLFSGLLFIVPWQIFIHLNHFPADWIMRGITGNLKIDTGRLWMIAASLSKLLLLNEPFLIIVVLAVVYMIYRKESALAIVLYAPFVIQLIAYIASLYLQPLPIQTELLYTSERLILQIAPAILLLSLSLLFQSGVSPKCSKKKRFAE